MEDLALYLLWSGLVAAGVSAAAYVIYVFQPLLALLPLLGVAATSAGPLTATSNVGSSRRAPRSRTLGGVASLAAWASVAFGGAGLVVRTIALDHAPYSNLFEFSMAFGFAISLAYVLSEQRFGTRLLGAFVMPVAFGLYASALALEARSGAYPPSSPTAVVSPRLLSSWPSEWNTSEPQRSASLKESMDTG